MSLSSSAPVIRSEPRTLEHQDATIENLGDLLNDLRDASVIRNVLCHGSWRGPDNGGRSLPFFVNKKVRVFDTPIDIAFLRQVQRHAAELASAMVSTVTHNVGDGWRDFHAPEKVFSGRFHRHIPNR